MKHHATSRFWRCYRELPKDIRKLADRCYALLESDPTHGSLQFKKIGPLWSVRVGLHYRALATEVANDIVWFWIGSHAGYDILVGRKPSTRSPKKTGRTRKKTRPTRRHRTR